MSNFSARMHNKERLNTSGSSLPDFPGKMLAHNGQSGNFIMMNPGDDINDASKIQSLEFVVDFTMTRLRYHESSKESYTSNYVVAGTGSDYRLTVNNQTVIGRNKAEVANQLLSGDKIRQEQIYIGYAAKINGQPQPSAVAIWYVSRGNNSWLLNEAVNAAGGLQSNTIIAIANNRTVRKNSSGGSNLVLDFFAEQLDDSRIDALGSWVDASGIADEIDAYKEAMIEATNSMAKQPAVQSTPGFGNQINNNSQQFNQGFNDPQNGSQQQFNQQPSAVQTGQQTALGLNQMFGNQNGQTLPPVGGNNPQFNQNQEIDISDDDLPF